MASAEALGTTTFARRRGTTDRSTPLFLVASVTRRAVANCVGTERTAACACMAASGRILKVSALLDQRLRSLRKRTRSPKTRSTEEFQVRTTPRRALDPNTGSSACDRGAVEEGDGPSVSVPTATLVFWLLGIEIEKRVGRWRTGSGAAGGGGEGNLSANADVELQRERCESMEGSERRGQRRVSIRSAVRRSGRARVEVSQPRDQPCRPSAGDGAARTHPNVDEGNRAGDEAERGPQQTLLTHDGHQRAIRGVHGE